VFRAAHSIKGGAGTFGFDAIAGLTHVLETLLDELRAGKRALEASRRRHAVLGGRAARPAARSRTRPGRRRRHGRR
jgi:chemotaxis protein histidine kinase CheA